MSKERELLERWVDDRILEPEELDSLMKETKELLAQPEQEPVAWLHEWVDETGETVRSIYSHFYEHINLIPLYTSHTTRKPLSDEEIGAHTPFYYYDTEQKAFTHGVRLAEQQHGIGVDDE